MNEKGVCLFKYVKKISCTENFHMLLIKSDIIFSENSVVLSFERKRDVLRRRKKRKLPIYFFHSSYYFPLGQVSFLYLIECQGKYHLEMELRSFSSSFCYFT